MCVCRTVCYIVGVYFSDKLSRACKIRDEYSLVKDLVQERDRKRLAVAPVTAPYGDSNDARKGIC